MQEEQGEEGEGEEGEGKEDTDQSGEDAHKWCSSSPDG